MRISLLSIWVFALYHATNVNSLQSSSTPTLVLIDPFTSYLSGHCREYCSANGIELVEAVSPYTASVLKSSGKIIPESLMAPEKGKENEWALAHGLLSDDEDEGNVDRQIMVISESDAGVSTAERIQTALGIKRSNGISPHLRNKFEQNQRAAVKGLPIVAQKLASDWSEAEQFIHDLWNDPDAVKKCIIKPYRGVASDGVHLCTSISEAKACFDELLGSPRYGTVGGKQESVLVQEFADGNEYAVDTVTCDGVTKVVALWRYVKFPANGAPFVYQCSELVSDPTSEECVEVMDYTVAVLEAQDLKFGPTHTEVKFTPDGPRLMEINARWHAQHFQPITQMCLGNDALEITMDACFNPDKFSVIPDRPAAFLGRGLILHLISYKEGVISEVRHMDTMRDLRSCRHLSIDFEQGMELRKTVDIRTDCGYVLLAHKDANVLGADYDYICRTLQNELFSIEGEENVEGEAAVASDDADVEVEAESNHDNSPSKIETNAVEEDIGESDTVVDVEVDAPPNRRPRPFSRTRRRDRSSRRDASAIHPENEQNEQHSPFQPDTVPPARSLHVQKQRNKGILERTAVGSILLLATGYVASLVTVLLLPSAE